MANKSTKRGLGALLGPEVSAGGARAKRAKKIKKGTYTSFDAMVRAIMRDKGYGRKRAEGIAAARGRKTYGKKGFASLSKRGKTKGGKRLRSAIKERGL